MLNCMGIVILKYSGTDVSYAKLGMLEFFKDIPIVLMSLLSVNLINKTGTRAALMFSLSVIVFCCILIPLLDDFWFFKIWFILIGLSFAIAKISVFGIVRNNVKKEKELSRLMNRIEASFMIGIFCVNIFFGWLLSSAFAEFWKFGFWLISVLSIFTIWKLRNSQFAEVPSASLLSLKNIAGIFTSRNILFLAILFLIVMMEQCFNSWLPTFYKNNLNANSFFALQSSAFLGMFSFLGRYITSKVITRVSWFWYILSCLLILIILLLLAQLLVSNVKQNLWILMLVFPVLGLFTAPLYPLYNSRLLMHTEKHKINILVSVIVVFSSLGSSLGSLGMSLIFEKNYHEYFLFFTSLPVIIITFLTLVFFKSLILR